MRLGQYRIDETLSSHGLHMVCRARGDDDARVILKILSEEALTPARAAALRQGYSLMREIDHPRVAAVKSLERVNGQLALVMHDVGGRTLADRLAEGALSQSEALHIAIATAEALAAIHDANVIHGDVTPRNLIVGEGPDEVVVE